MKKIIDCGDCPCLSSYYSNIGGCNLGYDTQDGKIDGKSIHYSEDCELQETKFRKGGKNVSYRVQEVLVEEEPFPLITLNPSEILELSALRERAMGEIATLEASYLRDK